MNKFNSRIACGVLSGCLIAGCFTGCGKLDGTQTVATVDGEEVTLGLASYILRDQQAQISHADAGYILDHGADAVDAGGGELVGENEHLIVHGGHKGHQRDDEISPCFFHCLHIDFEILL